MQNNKIQVIVIGGGFAGIQLVKHLDENIYEVLLIDKINHHQFQPLFYQVATSRLEPSNISFPLRKLFQDRKNVQIRLAEVTQIEAELNIIKTTIGEFYYDILIIATGCRTNYFGNEDLKKYAFGLKSTYDAIKIRNSILQGFEDMISATEEERAYLSNIVIVGAGPTGVELAGAFAEIKRNILPKDFPSIDFNSLQILLIEGSKNTLNNMSENAMMASQHYLEDLGVVIKTECRVQGYDGQTVTLSSGEQIKTKHLIWAAGVKGNLIPGLEGSTVLYNSRMKVDRANLVDGYKNIYALGDIACMETELYPKGHPQVANVAINQAKNLAKNLNRKKQGKPLLPYEYTDLGSMATIGKHKAVVDLPFIKFNGYLAWFVWMFLHLMLILSVKSKLMIFINWAWAYLTKDTSLRLILKDHEDH